MKSVIIKLCVYGILVGLISGSETSCQDIDHNACMSMFKQNPDMCQDAILSRSVCPRACNNCPLICYSCTTPSDDVTSCNKITCNQHQSCMIQSADDDGPFTLGCISDSMCNQGNHGTSGHNSNTTKCCDNDLCNAPTVPTTPPPTVPSYRGPMCYSCKDKSIAEAPSCQNVTCGKGEKCSTRSYFGSNVYTLACMTQYYCNYFDQHTNGQGSASTVCCETDFCNIPQHTTTGVPPVATVSHVLQQPYPVCPRDILVFLDQSAPFRNNWSDVKRFLTDIVSTMNIGPGRNQTRMSMDRFDGFHHGGWTLDRRNHNKTELLLSIQTLLPRAPRYAPHGNMDIAVVQLHHNPAIYGERFGNQPAAPDVPIFITGSSGRRNDVMLADLIQRYNDIITIGIGNITNKDSVSYVATDSNHAIFLDTTTKLLDQTFERRVLRLICGTA